jgi:hypothetical protein
MMRTKSHDPGEAAKAGRMIYIRLDFVTHAPDQFRLRITPRPFGMAAPAGTVSGLLRLFRHREE